MSASSEGTPQPRSLIELIVASFGMAFVALVCASSGLLYGSGKLIYGTGEVPQLEHWLTVLGFFSLVLPYFFYREATVEEPQLSARDRSNNTFTAVTLTILFSIISILGVPSAGIDWHRGLYLFSLMLLALLPFSYLGLRSNHLLRLGETAAHNERRFRNKVLLPAFATCLVSFSFGWSIAGHDSTYLCVLLTVAFIILVKELMIARPLFPLSGIFSIFLFALSVLFILYRSAHLEFAKVLIIGTLLTFAMGVAEVCKRVVRYRERDHGATVESYDLYLAGSNWSSILFPLLLCFLPLIIDDLPVLPIFLLLSIQYLLWHHFSGRRRGRTLSVVNTVLGFLLPIFLCLQYLINIKPVFFGYEIFDSLLGLLAIVLAVIVGTLALFGHDLRKFLRDSQQKRIMAYLDYKNCFFFFIFVVVLVLISIAFYATITYGLSGVVTIKAKASETVLGLLLLLVIVITVSGFNIASGRIPVDPPSGGSPEKKDNMPQTPPRAARNMWAIKFGVFILHVARLPVGLIAGFAVGFIVARHTSLGWWHVFLQMIPITLVTMIGFVLNDIFDLDKDRIAQRDKPLATGLVSVEAAGLAAIVLTGVMLAISFAIARGNSVPIVFITLAGVIVYSWWAQKFPTLKGIATALLCCAPFAYAAEISGITFPTEFYGFLLVFITGRELLLDVKDFEGDRRAGVLTLVAYMNPIPSRIIGWTLMISSIVLVLARTTGIGQVIFFFSFLSLGGCLILYLKNERRGLAWSRLTLLGGVIAAAFSS